MSAFPFYDQFPPYKTDVKGDGVTRFAPDPLSKPQPANRPTKDGIYWAKVSSWAKYAPQIGWDESGWSMIEIDASAPGIFEYYAISDGFKLPWEGDELVVTKIGPKIEAPS